MSLSLIATHDELVRCTNILINGSCEDEFLQFAINQEEMRQKWLVSVQECQRLHSALEKAHHESMDLERKLSHARRLLDEEKKKRRNAEEQKNSVERQIALARELLFTDGGRNLNDETREKLQFLNNTTLNGRHSSINRDFNDKLNTIAELDSSGSLLSDLSCFSKSGDDLDASAVLNQHCNKRDWKDHRPSGEYSSAKKRRSSNIHKVADLNTSDRIVATTTVVVPKEGAITASSVIEAIPADENTAPTTPHLPRKRKKSSERKSKKDLDFDKTNELPKPSAPLQEIATSGSDSEGVFKPSPNIGGYTFNTKSMRTHSFVGKSIIRSETCLACNKRIRFGKMALKCRDCKAVAHCECKDLVPLPCIATGNTPILRGASGTIADYTPMNPPMVPSLVVHCINELELRGMNEKGLYRINGNVTHIKTLKDKFFKGRGAPNLANEDLSTICSTLKNFLKSLKEPLITVGLWADFVKATTLADKQDADAALYQAISELPQPNRDTLAFLILHLQRVSTSSECEMTISNIARIFGPTIVGYSSLEPSSRSMFDETQAQIAVVESLLKIPSDYWANFVNPDNLQDIVTPKTGELKHTPSTESLLKRNTSRGFFNTPLGSSRTFLRKKQKYFATPPL